MLTRLTRFDAYSPLVLVVVQLCLILLFSRLLVFAFEWARQLRVDSEMLAGILLGEAASDQISGITANSFSLDTIPFLSLIDDLGLVLFLFACGTDIDFSLRRRDVRSTVAVPTAKVVIPFGSGWAISVGLRKECVHPSVKLTTLMTSISSPTNLTAFPFLSHILTEPRLLSGSRRTRHSRLGRRLRRRRLVRPRPLGRSCLGRVRCRRRLHPPRHAWVDRPLALTRLGLLPQD